MASKGINKAIIVGNLGNDPEMKYMPNGTAVTNISVATSESWTDKNTGQATERTEWHRIEAYGKLAEIMGQYLRKGSKVYIEGSLRTDKWTDQSGVDRYSTKIRCDTMQMLDSKASDGSTEYSAPTKPANNKNNPNNQNNQKVNQSKEFKAPDINMDDDFGDDIPF